MRWGYLHFSRFPAQRKVIEVPELSGQPFVLEEEVPGPAARGLRLVQRPEGRSADGADADGRHGPGALAEALPIQGRG